MMRAHFRDRTAKHKSGGENVGTRKNAVITAQETKEGDKVTTLVAG